MAQGWSEWAWLVAIVAAAMAGSWFVSQRRLRKAMQQCRREWEQQVSALDEAIRGLEARLAEMRASGDASLRPLESGAQISAAEEPGGDEAERETAAPEVQAAIAAAAVAFVGENARVRAAARVQSTEPVSAWSQQGRVTVQTSHNLRPSRWSNGEGSRGKEA